MNSLKYIIGIDEVGRGPIAGPVAVCAFRLLITDYQLLIEDGEKELGVKIKDSKKLTKIQREKWFEYLKKCKTEGKCEYAVSYVSSENIDKFGISKAIKKALATSLEKIVKQNMQDTSQGEQNLRALPSLRGLRRDSDFVHLASFQIFLDGGLKAPVEYVNQETIIKGDELHPIISCASIMAKVSRDAVMHKFAQDYPEYGFENHVGYGTKAHYEAIEKSGITPLHRKSFLKKIL